MLMKHDGIAESSCWSFLQYYHVALSNHLSKIHDIPVHFFVLTVSPPSTTKVPYSNSLDPNETPSNLASHLDPSCLTIRQHFHKL